MNVSPTTSTRVRAEGVPAAAASARAGNADLLPLPGASTDPAAGLLFLMTSLQNQQLTRGEGKARANEAERRDAIAAEERARKAAEEAANGGGLFDFFSEDLGLLGMAGAVMGCWAVFGADVVLDKLGVLGDVKVDLVDVGAWALGGPALLALDVVVRKLELAPDVCREALTDLGLGSAIEGLEDSDVQKYAKTLVTSLALVAGSALTVLSAGSAAGLVVAGFAVALSAGGHVVAETKALDGLLGENASALFGAAAQIASGALTLGATATGQLALATSRAGALRTVVQSVDAGARGVDTGLLTAHGLAASRATNDAEAASARETELRGTTESLVDGLRAAKATLDRAKQALFEAARVRDATPRALLRA